VSLSGAELPNARTLTTHLLPDAPFRAYYTHLKMAYGQFINHDITHTPVYQAEVAKSDYSAMINCCPNPTHKQCFAIKVPQDPKDHFYGQNYTGCMNFVRSSPCPLCDLGPRQQLNQATSFMDLSSVYGATLNQSAGLREWKWGYLRWSVDSQGHQLLPQSAHPYKDQCSAPQQGMKCFEAGDKRVNQHPALMSLQTLWMRRHNQHCDGLRRVNPQWDDERLYQEARRLNIAEVQHVTYSEYLKIVFGPTLMKYFNLDCQKSGYSNYEPHTDPTTWNDYATTACRFGHSQISGFFKVLMPSAGGQYKDHGYWIRDKFFDPQPLYDSHIDGIVRGLLSESGMSVDPHIDSDVKNYLYRAKHEKFGSDLPAFNIQRGRDHGIPGYTRYLQFCFGYKANSWEDLYRFIPKERVDNMRQHYRHYDDVDFFVGGISEKHFTDADVGPTFACVLGIQYYHLKAGDRYYFEHGGQAGSFTPAQLDNIRNVATLAQFLCKTSDNLGTCQKHAFFPVSKYNPAVPCNAYPEIDYNLWK
jgi:peroxidase